MSLVLVNALEGASMQLQFPLCWNVADNCEQHAPDVWKYPTASGAPQQGVRHGIAC